MTSISFYILSDVDRLARRRFACRLAQRALQEGQRVHVRAGAQDAADLDELMWDYPPEGFLPHAPLADAKAEPITIGAPDQQPEHAQMLINLEADIPARFAHFERVAEIILGNERKAGRDKYRRYRERGYPLFHHELDNWE